MKVLSFDPNWKTNSTVNKDGFFSKTTLEVLELLEEFDANNVLTKQFLVYVPTSSHQMEVIEINPHSSNSLESLEIVYNGTTYEVPFHSICLAFASTDAIVTKNMPALIGLYTNYLQKLQTTYTPPQFLKLNFNGFGITKLTPVEEHVKDTPKKEPEDTGPKKCKCSLSDLMTHGCKCGGV